MKTLLLTRREKEHLDMALFAILPAGVFDKLPAKAFARVHKAAESILRRHARRLYRRTLQAHRN
jgi:hypothetical protein